MVTDEEERSSLKLEKVGQMFSSLTMLLGGKLLKIADLLEIKSMPVLSFKGYVVDQ